MVVLIIVIIIVVVIIIVSIIIIASVAVIIGRCMYFVIIPNIWFQGFLCCRPSGLKRPPCPCSSHLRRYSIQISTLTSFFN